MGNKTRFYYDIMSISTGVTGSCDLVIVRFPDNTTQRFVVDCGLFQEKEWNNLNSEELPFNPEKVDFALLTHVHVDHCGRLPYMVKKGFNKGIYASKESCNLLKPALTDSCTVLSSASKKKREKPLYSEVDVKKTLQALKPCNFRETYYATPNIRVTFLENGHLAGAGSILIQMSYYGYEDIDLLITGDYAAKNIFFDVEEIPKWILELPLTVVQESTYGTTESSQIVKTFENNIKEQTSKGGSVLCLAFSLGRSQEILYTLKTMQDKGTLDCNIPIYFDGKLAFRYTHLYLKEDLGFKEGMKEFLPQNLTFVDKTMRKEVLQSKTQKIIITTSGMGSFGPAQVYIPEYLTRKDTLIQFTGYVAEGTLGRKIRDSQEDSMVEVGGILLKKRARVEYTTEFSAHAKADEMIQYLKQFKNLKLVLVTHGEPEVKKAFGERILHEVDVKKVGILDRSYFFRVDRWGLVKPMTTKFE